MSEHPYPPSWPSSTEDGSPTVTGHPATRRAALLLWILGGLQMLFFGCCALSFTAIAMTPIETLNEIVKQNPPPGDLSLEQLTRFALPAAIGMLLIGFGPALVYVVLAFGVRAGKSGPIIVCLILTIGQTALLGLLLALNILGGLAQGAVEAVAANLIMLGPVLALLAATIYWLFRARSQPSFNPSDEVDPWNQP